MEMKVEAYRELQKRYGVPECESNGDYKVRGPMTPERILELMESALVVPLFVAVIDGITNKPYMGMWMLSNDPVLKKLVSDGNNGVKVWFCHVPSELEMKM